MVCPAIEVLKQKARDEDKQNRAVNDQRIPDLFLQSVTAPPKGAPAVKGHDVQNGNPPEVMEVGQKTRRLGLA